MARASHAFVFKHQCKCMNAYYHYCMRRSWNPHTLAIKDIVCSGSYASIRVLSCSLDRCIVLYDMHCDRQLFRIAFSEGLESIALNGTRDFAFVGSSSGPIFTVDLSVASINTSAANALVTTSLSGGVTGTRHSLVQTSGNTAGGGGGLPAGVKKLDGHSKAVLSLSCSADNCTLVSGSEDGSVRFWDIWTQQCIREMKPLNKAAITNALVQSHYCKIPDCDFKMHHRRFCVSFI